MRQKVRSLVDAVQRRFNRSRPGSVLILVVALLVLMALIGTAYISTARIDRYSAQQNAANTQIEMLLQGVVNMAQAAMGNFNPAQRTDDTTTDAWLGDRVPTGLGTTPTPAWQAMTGFLASGQYESPQNSNGYTTRNNMAPTSITLATSTGTQLYPALQPVDVSGNPVATPGAPFLAADTDGDGIADAGLFRLPMGQINGVTYYGAVRIIDNAAAMNASIGWTPSINSAQFFPTNIDLQDALVAPAEVTALNQYRFNDPTPAAALVPVDDTGAARGDFTFVSMYDAFWNQLGRRLLNPGYNSASAKYQALPVSESIAMAYRFCLQNPNSSPSILEASTTGIPSSVSRASNANIQTSAYAANDVSNWYARTFNYSAGQMPLRPLLVSRNPVSNFAPSKFGPSTYNANQPITSRTWSSGTAYNFGDWVYYQSGSVLQSYVCIQPTASVTPSGAANSTAYWTFEPWFNNPTKTSINTATFSQLWLAYWAVMCDGQNTLPSYISGNANKMMFRSSLRDPSSSGAAALTPLQQLKLRAALAAVNTLDLRDSDANVTSQQITLTDDSTGNPVYNVMLYGNEPQPYITEVYADNNPGSTNGTGYIAIELYNPYPADIKLTNWQLATISRPPGGAGPQNLTLTPVASTAANWSSTAGNAPTVPANGFLTIVSSPTMPSQIPPTMKPVGSTVIVLDLAPQAFNQELVLLRPRFLNGSLTSNTDSSNAMNSYNEGTITDLVPVDSYDFTGLATGPTIMDPGTEWHYVRPNAVASQKAWHFIYPGGYDASRGTTDQTPRNAGTFVAPGGTLVDMTTFGVADAASLATAQQPYREFPVQLNNYGFAGPNTLSGSGNKYPFGEFARNGDIMEAPFIGAYRVQSISTGKIVELNAVTMDSVYAEDNDTADDAGESVGHFCPIYPGDVWGAVNDYGADQTKWRYRFAARLFDNLTTEAPHDDYLPNTDPVKYAQYVGAGASPVANVKPTVINALASNPNGATEDSVPLDGLININTAPWRVLATIPFVYTGTPANDQVSNSALAQAIATFRDQSHGPFKSIYELNLAPGFRATTGTYQGSYNPNGNDPEFTNNVYNDFQSQNLALTRISNLITTRSDSFTVYVLVQGWKGAGKSNPTLVVQRRAAFIADRSGLTPSNKSISVTNVPTN